jgi:branched-chain amino acid transport system ATP-binding protein
MAEIVLAAEHLSVAYGPIKAVRDCSFVLHRGETVTIVGANGAGKSTIMRALSNLIPHQSGAIRYLGAVTEGLPPHALAQAGLLHVPEGRGVLGRLTVLENLRIAYDVRRCKESFERALDAVYSRFPRLRERAKQRAGLMSGGEQQMLALAKAVVNPPSVLLVDEPSLGLAPIMIREAFKALAELRRSGIAILLVEQNVRSALALADRAYVLRQGEIVMEGDSKALLRQEDLLKQHLVTQAVRANARG